jgi:hypothetical protein
VSSEDIESWWKSIRRSTSVLSQKYPGRYTQRRNWCASSSQVLRLLVPLLE